MRELTELRAERISNARAMRRLLDINSGSKWNASAQAEYDRRLSEMDRLDMQILAFETERDRRADSKVEDAMADAYRERGRGNPTFCAWLRHGEDERALSASQLQSIRNTMSTTTGSQGGFTVPSLVADRFSDILKDYSAVRRFAEVFRDKTGGPFGWPSSDGSAETAELVAENATTTNLDPSFATSSLQCWKYSSKFITAPYELVQDAEIGFEGYVLRRAASRIGRLQNTHYTNGTGTGQPTGFTGLATSGKTGLTGQTTTVLHDDLIDLTASVDTAYRQIRAGLCFQMAESSFKVVRKLKDTAGRPLYLPADGEQPETILGYPVAVNNDVAAMAANAKSIFFGNFFEGYKIRDGLEVTLFRIDGNTDSVLAKSGQVGFIGFARSGGNLVDTASVKYYQNSAT